MGGGGTTIQAPAPPNYGQSMREVLTSQVELMPQVYASEQQYQPKFAELQAQTQGYLAQQALNQAKQLYPQVAELEKTYQEQNRINELAALQKTLPQYQAAFNQLTPGYQEALTGMGKVAQQAAEAAQQRPDLANYAAQVQGPTSGQYLGAVQQYQPGTQFGGVGMPREVGFLRGVQGPAQSSGLGQVDQSLVQQYAQAVPGMEQAAQVANQIAAQEMQAGRNLSPEEERQAQQAARAAYAARGTALGPQAMGAEILGRSELANQRFAQRLATAAGLQQQVQAAYAPALQQALARQQGVAEYGLSAQGQLFQQQAAKENLAQQIQQQRYAQAMGREQLLGGAQAQAFQQAGAREQLAGATQEQAFQQALGRQQADIQRLQAQTGIQAQQAQLAGASLAQLQAAQAPMLQAFYKQPIMQGQANYAQQMGLSSQQAMGPQFFNPESPTGMGSIYGAYNAQAGLAGAQAQANAGKQAGMMQGLGALGGGIATGVGLAMMTCWVAREVYGIDNPKWMIFREWLLNEAPEWLRSLYLNHGARFAQFIKGKPLLKFVIRKMMDVVVNAKEGTVSSDNQVCTQ